MSSAVCAELVPSDSGVQGCGRSLWLSVRTRALEMHTTAMFHNAGLKDPRPLEPSSDWRTRWLEQKEFVDGRDALKAPYFERIKRALLKAAAAEQQRLGALEAEEMLEARVWHENEGVVSRRSTEDKKRRHHWVADLECREQADLKRRKLSKDDLWLGDNSSDDSD